MSTITSILTLTFGNVWYVCSVNGADSGGTAGLNRLKPLATLVQAYANASDDDVIVLLAGHQETLTALHTIGKSVTIVGQGNSAGRPAASLTNNSIVGMLEFTVAGCELRNVWIKAQQTANVTSKLKVSAAAFRMLGCYVECSENDQGIALELATGADYPRLSGNTFVSTAASPSARPNTAVSATAALVNVEMAGNVISSGASGWSGTASLDFSGSTVAPLKIQSQSLLYGADARIASGSTGWINPQAVTGGPRVLW